MNKVLKQVLGVDVDQRNLVITLGRLTHCLSVELYAHEILPNNQNGFKSLLKWTQSKIDQTICFQVVMEATGVYHQKFAYFLDDRNISLSIVLPNKMSNYMRTLEIKTITDKTSSQAICRFGLERKLDAWVRPKEIFRKLQQLTRERSQIIDERTVAKNQLHAENAEIEPNKGTIRRLKARIKLFDKHIAEIENEIDDYLKKDNQLNKRIRRITTPPGVGKITAVIALAETNGFELIRNRRQLASYAGFDVKEKLSGTSVKGKSRISKKGNKYLRKAMYFPAMTAINYNQSYGDLYDRIVDRTGIKMKGMVAVQRKLLELIYTLDKNEIDFDPEYENSVSVKKTTHAIQTGSKAVLVEQI